MIYHQKIIPFAEYDYIVAVCPKMQGERIEDRKQNEEQYCHNDCDLHSMIFSSEIRQKYVVHLLCIPNESQKMVAKATDVMERMKLTKTQPQLKEFLGIDKEGFPIEKDKWVSKE